MCHTHTTTDCDIETLQLAILSDNGNETKIVSENINVIGRWYSNSNFELCKIIFREQEQKN